MQNDVNEEWRDIEGYQGIYQVSNFGRVKSLKFGKEKILRPRKTRNGYLRVNLCKNEKLKGYYIHRLIATAFIPNPMNLPTVNHIDEDKTNNNVTNLEWMNLSQQQRHGTCQQRRVANTDYKARTAKIDYQAIGEKLSKQVYQYSLDGTLVAIWESTTECGRQGFNQGNVAACCRGELKTHRGYIWSYSPLN